MVFRPPLGGTRWGTMETDTLSVRGSLKWRMTDVDKRYQVFVSSTYEDLKDERREVVQALLELDCFPCGMELFQAEDEDSWSIIQRVIEESDYYIVIVGGRYGSIHPESKKSYTQMEYEFAVERNKPVLAFLHANRDGIPSGKTEADAKGKRRLDAFIGILKGRQVKLWNSAAELGGAVSKAIVSLRKHKPGVGWIRADHRSDASAKEILGLRKHIDRLTCELQEITTHPLPGTEGLAQGDDEHTVSLQPCAWLGAGVEYAEQELEFTWNELFSAVAPILMTQSTESEMRCAIGQMAFSKYGKSWEDNFVRSFAISNNSFHTIKIQLKALGLIMLAGKHWTLTKYGNQVITNLLAIRRQPAMEVHPLAARDDAIPCEGDPQDSADDGNECLRGQYQM